MTKGKEIPMRPVKAETLTPRQFVRVERGDIKGARIIPPRLGSRSLGKIKVEYKHPKYKPA